MTGGGISRGVTPVQVSLGRVPCGRVGPSSQVEGGWVGIACWQILKMNSRCSNLQLNEEIQWTTPISKYNPNKDKIF